MNKLSFLFIIFCWILVSGCQEDINQFSPNGQAATFTSDIFGIVHDEDGLPVEGALVKYNGTTTTTDKYGIYTFDDTKVKSDHNFLTITKDGYFEACKTFRTVNNNELQFKTILVPKIFDLTVSGASGGKVSKSNITLTFEPNSVVVEATNQDYSGEVKVAIHFLNPLDWETFDIMPGDLTSVNANSEIGTLLSHGMAYVELQSPDGQKLQVKAGKKVKMEMEINSNLRDEAKSDIPMWYFDYKTGLWVEDGVAQRAGNIFVASVSHFSCWNYDYNYPSIILSGKIVDKNGHPIPDLHVWVSPVGEYLGGHGNTQVDGTFSGRVPKGLELELKLYYIKDKCFTEWSNPQKVIKIGSFNADADLGDIVFDIPELKYVHLTGSFFDCNNQLVQNGFVVVNGRHSPIKDGKIDINLQFCTNDPITIYAVDQDKLLKSDQIVVSIESEINLGSIQICNNISDYLSYRCDLEQINGIIIENLSVGKNTFNGESFVSAEIMDSLKNENRIFIGFYTPFPDNIIPVGTYNSISHRSYITINDNTNGAYYFLPQGGEVNITATGSNPGEYVQGNYKIFLKKEGDQSGKIYEFYGSFRIKM